MYSIKDWLRVEPKEIVRKIIEKGYRVELYMSAFRGCDLRLKTHKALFNGFLRAKYGYGINVFDFISTLEKKDVESVVLTLIDEVERAKEVSALAYAHYVQHVIDALGEITTIANEDLKKLCGKLMDCGLTLLYYCCDRITKKECIEHLNEDLGKIVAILEREEVL